MGDATGILKGADNLATIIDAVRCGADGARYIDHYEGSCIPQESMTSVSSNDLASIIKATRERDISWRAPCGRGPREIDRGKSVSVCIQEKTIRQEWYTV